MNSIGLSTGLSALLDQGLERGQKKGRGGRAKQEVLLEISPMNQLQALLGQP